MLTGELEDYLDEPKIRGIIIIVLSMPLMLDCLK
jgi:hypothetical protein